MKRKPSLSLAIILILVAFFLSSIVGGLVATYGFSWAESESLETFVTYGITAVLTVIFIFLFKKPYQLFVPNFKPEIRKLSPTLIVTGFILVIAMGIVIDPMIQFIPEWGMDILDQQMTNGLWAMMAAVILAPLFEEFMCRGVIQTNLVNKIGPIWGIVLASFIFGAIHLIPQQAFAAMMVGLVIGSVYYITGSLNTVIAIHFLNNGLASLMYMLFGKTTLIEDTLRANETLHIITYSVSLIILILGGAYVIKYARDRKVAR